MSGAKLQTRRIIPALAVLTVATTGLWLVGCGGGDGANPAREGTFIAEMMVR